MVVLKCGPIRLITQPPVVVQVLHWHLMTIEVIALQISEQRRYLSLAHQIVVGITRLLQTQNGVRRLNSELTGLSTLRADVERHKRSHRLKCLIRGDNIIVGIGLP